MKKTLSIVAIFIIVFSMFSMLTVTPTAAQGEPVPILELTIPDTARVVDFDDGIYVLGTSSGSLYVINEAGEYTVTDLGVDYFINDVRIENPYIVVAANHIYDRGEYYYDGTYYRYVSFDGGYVIKFVLGGLTPVESWRTYIAAWGSWSEYRWDGISLGEYFPLPSVDISSDGNYVAYLSRSTVGVLSGDDGAPIASYSIAGAYIVSWLDATADMEYIAITAEVGPYYSGVNTGVELYRFDHVAGTLTKQWGSILIYNYETMEVRVSEAKNYVAAATSSGIFMNLLDLTTGNLLWSYDAGQEQFACDGDDDLNYVVGGTQAGSAPYKWFILRNWGTSYDVVAEGHMEGAINDLDSTPDAAYFAFGSDAGEVILLRRTDNSIETIYSFNIDKMIDSIEIGTHTFLVGGENFINLYYAEVIEEWPFAIITDLHIGFGYPDYGPEGFDEPERMDDSAILRLCEDYYLTDRLTKIVESINNNPQIKFVVVLGDIGDTAEYSEFLKAREILNMLNVPYIPILGNHDVWPYTQEADQEKIKELPTALLTGIPWDHFDPDLRKDKEQNATSACGDIYFNEIFWEHNDENIKKIGEVFAGSFRRQYTGLHILQATGLPQILQNYVFVYNGIKFIVLDCNARKIDASGAQLFNETRDWLNESLTENEPTIIFSHHPTLFATLPLLGTQCFNSSDMDSLRQIIEESKAKVLASFGGHSHANFIAGPGYEFTDHISISIPKSSLIAAIGVSAGLIPGADPIVLWEGDIEVVNRLNADVVITEAVCRESINWTERLKELVELIKPEYADQWPKLPLRTETRNCIRTVTILGKEVASYSRLDSVTEDSNLPPTSYFTYRPTKPTRNKKFTAFPYDPDGNPKECEYFWVFVPGIPTTDVTRRSVRVEYPRKGDYTATLLVKDNGGAKSNPFSRTISVRSRFEIKLWCPAYLVVTDPEGFTLTKDMGEVPSMSYIEELDIDGDGELDDIVAIWELKIGDYLITVIPEPDASPTDTYTLGLWADDIVTVIAENVQISNIPTQPYIVRSTGTEVIPIIPATADFDPDTLNLKSKGQWVTVYIELPVGHGYDVNMINLTTVMLNGQVYAEAKPFAIGDYDSDGIPDLMVKFNRAAVQTILQVGDKVEIIISGKLIDERLFEGKDTIQVILPP
jgi:PKD repeat protein